MKVLVTGGCGFIGTYVSENLEARDIEPVIFDRNRHRHDREVFLGDIRDEEAIRAAVYATDGIVHLAGVLGTQETLLDPSTAASTNILGSLNVFKACRDFGKRAAYITVGNHWMNNPYSITKSASERFALMANKEWGTEIAVVRALNAYGPKQKWEPVRKLMPNLVRTALHKAAFNIYGDGEQVMDHIYVQDLAVILTQALLTNHRVYDVPFEAGTGARTTVNDICREVYEQAETPLMTLHTPMRAGEEPGAIVLGNPETLAPLGVEPKDLMTLKEGVARTIQWYRQHL